jgi:hypothetical protein
MYGVLVSLFQVLEHGTPLAWRAGTLFGILLRCTPEELVTLGIAMADGALTMDEDLEVHRILCKLGMCSGYISYYKLHGVFLCVSVYVYVCVCPAIRFHISQLIFSKFGGNILWVMTCIVGYYFFCVHATRTCA